VSGSATATTTAAPTSGTPGATDAGFLSGLGGLFNDFSGGLLTIPGAIVGTFSDLDTIVTDGYKAAKLFFMPSTYVRIGAGAFGLLFIILGMVGLVREARNS
jgi:hypothetical protein